VVTYGLKIVVGVVGVSSSVASADVSSVGVRPADGGGAGGAKFCSLVCTLGRT
jgi:hypothetical protein